jgi:hypothetical protein
MMSYSKIENTGKLHVKPYKKFTRNNKKVNRLLKYTGQTKINIGNRERER